MFHLFRCKHKRVASKFLRTPRYDQEAVIEYTVCEDCGKQLSCQVKLVPAFKYPERPPKIVTVKVEAKANTSLVIKKPEPPKAPVPKEQPKKSVPVIPPVAQPIKPVAPGEAFVKSNKKKRNVGRKPSAPTAPEGATLGNLVRSVYEKAEEKPNKTPLKVSIQDDLDKTYSKFEDDDEGDDDLQVVRRESPEDSERRFKRARRREQRKG